MQTRRLFKFLKRIHCSVLHNGAYGPLQPCVESFLLEGRPAELWEYMESLPMDVRARFLSCLLKVKSFQMGCQKSHDKKFRTRSLTGMGACVIASGIHGEKEGIHAGIQQEKENSQETIGGQRGFTII